MSNPTHDYLNRRHNMLTADVAELNRTETELSRMRRLLEELPAQIEAAEQHQKLLTRQVERDRQALSEEGQAAKWAPLPAGQPSIEQQARAAVTSTQGLPITQPVERDGGER